MLQNKVSVSEAKDPFNDIDSVMLVGGQKAGPRRNPVVTTEPLPPRETDIDDLLSMPSKIYRHSLTDLATPKPQLLQDAPPIKRSDTFGSIYDARQNGKALRKPSALRVAFQPAAAPTDREKEAANVEQDIDALLRVSTIQPRQQRSGQTTPDRRRSTHGSFPSLTSLEHEVTTISVSTYGASVAGSDAPLVSRTPKAAVIDKDKMFEGKTGQQKILTLTSYGTDIDTLLSLPHAEKPDNPKRVKSEGRPHSSSLSQIKETPPFNKSRVLRPRANTLLTFLGKRSAGNILDEGHASFMSFVAIAKQNKENNAHSCNDIDDFINISNPEVDPNFLPGHSTKTIDAIDRPRSGHIDADFLFHIAEQSQNGSQKYRDVLNDPEYQVTASSALQNVDALSDHDSNDIEISNNRINSFVSFKGLFQDSDVRASTPETHEDVDIDGLLEYGQEPHLVKAKVETHRRTARAVSELPPRTPQIITEALKVQDGFLSARVVGTGRRPLDETAFNGLTTTN